ncbi:MAG: redoxin domain-containing protein [Acidobacteria bacterium]|nr:MAG: redoxin domain-containing protein [Acidobacteriota bacterium]
MRISKSALSLMVGLLLVFLPAALAGADSTETAVLQVDGMTCGSCAAGIQSVLGNLDGVETADVNFAKGLATVRFDPELVSLEAMSEAIKGLGYEASVLPARAIARAGEQEAEDDLSREDMDKVVDFVVRHLTSEGSSGGLERADIEEAVGFAVPLAALNSLQSEVIGILQEKHPDTLAELTANSGSRCSDYGACSLHGDLAGASGDVLEMYEREKAEDGRLYDDYPLPEFEAVDLAGNPVSSVDLRGHPTVLTLMAGHCTHCHDSMPILADVIKKWGAEGLRVVNILVNSGTPESVNAWMSKLDPKFEVWVYNSDKLGDLLETHLVPAYLFVDADGKVLEKLVGYQERDFVLSKVESFMNPPVSLDVKAAAGAR